MTRAFSARRGVRAHVPGASPQAKMISRRWRYGEFVDRELGEPGDCHPRRPFARRPESASGSYGQSSPMLIEHAFGSRPMPSVARHQRGYFKEGSRKFRFPGVSWFFSAVGAVFTSAWGNAPGLDGTSKFISAESAIHFPQLLSHHPRHASVAK